jgi:hypothetical protein
MVRPYAKPPRIGIDLPVSSWDPLTGFGQWAFATPGAASHSLDQAQNLQTNYAKWIGELAAQFAKVQSTWAAKDAGNTSGYFPSPPGSEASFEADLAGLRSRFTRASVGVDAQARATVLSPRVADASNEYDALVKAVRQGGEGAPLQAGDFSDLTSRLQAYLASEGQAVNYSPAVQPTPELSSAFLEATDPTNLRRNFPWVKAAAIVGSGLVLSVLVRRR